MIHYCYFCTLCHESSWVQDTKPSHLSDVITIFRPYSNPYHYRARMTLPWLSHAVQFFTVLTTNYVIYPSPLFLSICGQGKYQSYLHHPNLIRSAAWTTARTTYPSTSNKCYVSYTFKYHTPVNIDSILVPSNPVRCVLLPKRKIITVVVPTYTRWLNVPALLIVKNEVSYATMGMWGWLLGTKIAISAFLACSGHSECYTNITIIIYYIIYNITVQLISNE